MHDAHTPSRWWYLAPNVLSGLRLGLAFAFPFVSPRFWVVIIIVSGLSDVADGAIARTFKLTSWIGGLLDAIADKAFVLSVLITLVVVGRFEWWEALIVLPRDLSVAIIAAYAAALRRWDGFQRMDSRIFGKLTTFFVFVLLVGAAGWPEQRIALNVLLCLAAISSTFAAVDYSGQFVRALRADATDRD